MKGNQQALTYQLKNEYGENIPTKELEGEMSSQHARTQRDY